MGIMITMTRQNIKKPKLLERMKKKMRIKKKKKEKKEDDKKKLGNLSPIVPKNRNTPLHVSIGSAETRACSNCPQHTECQCNPDNGKLKLPISIAGDTSICIECEGIYPNNLNDGSGLCPDCREKIEDEDITPLPDNDYHDAPEHKKPKLLERMKKKM